MFGIDSASIRRAETGRYGALHKYLRDRFAGRIVLTFGEIEDLLGFPLPAGARADAAWWSVIEAGSQSEQSDAWTVAERSATVNMPGQRVLFER